jgi:hypothetical protein
MRFLRCHDALRCALQLGAGYEVELFRDTAKWVSEHGQPEWAADNYTFTCMVRCKRSAQAAVTKSCCID